VQENSSGMNQLSKEQFSQLIQLLHQVKVSQSEPALSDVSANSASKNHYVSCHILIKSSKWILDSGALEHLSSNPELFTYPSPLTNPIYVNFPDSSKVKASHIGSVALFPDLIIHRVLYVPSFKINLLSIHKLCMQLECFIIFSSLNCVLQGPSMKRPLALGDVRDGLYQLGSTSLSSKKRVQHRDLASRTLCVVSVSSSVVIKGNSDVKLWHNRLRHLPIPAMKYIKSFVFKSMSNCYCDVCPLARQSKLPFPTSDIKTKSIFELIHIDTWGPYKSPTYNGFKYFLTIVDDFSKATWTYLLKTKSNVFFMLKYFLAMVERHFNCQVKIIRSDNALELGRSIIATEFFNSKGILHQTSCTATPQQNEVVERKHRHLLETSRSFLFQSGLPISFWGECVLTATFLVNRFPSRVLKGLSPYKVLYKQPPTYTNLRSFGCFCFAFTLSQSRPKFHPRALPCVSWVILLDNRDIS